MVVRVVVSVQGGQRTDRPIRQLDSVQVAEQIELVHLLVYLQSMVILRVLHQHPRRGEYLLAGTAYLGQWLCVTKETNRRLGNCKVTEQMKKSTVEKRRMKQGTVESQRAIQKTEHPA